MSEYRDQMNDADRVIVAGMDLTDLYDFPFPDDVPLSDVPVVSLRKLIHSDEAEIEKMFNASKSPGAFVLDLTDHPKGLGYLRNAVECARLARDQLKIRAVEEKRAYKARPRVGIMDQGYIAEEVGPDGEVKTHEVLNIPHYEYFCRGAGKLELPSWLISYDDMFRRTHKEGNELSNIILVAMEKALKLTPGALTSLHRLEDASSDLIRMVRHPGRVQEEDERITFPGHKDLSSLGLLFAPQGGLQLADPEDDGKFTWVKPIPGTLVVNIGEELEIITNGVLKGITHRVVRTSGPGASLDRVSSLIVTRVKGDAPLIPFQSPVIPERTEHHPQALVETSDEWAANKLRRITAQRANIGKRLPKELEFVYFEQPEINGVNGTLLPEVTVGAGTGWENKMYT